MKKLYLLLIFLFFATQHITAQTTLETFESAPTSVATFTSGPKTFNLTSSYGTFTVYTGSGLGYAGSNRFIQVSDSAGPEALGQFGTLTAAAGSFKVSNFWIYVSGDANQNAGVTSNGAAGSITFRGKLGGVTQFTVVKNTTGGNIGYTLPGNGFIYANFATDGAGDYTNVIIDQLEVQLSANYDYFAIDNFTFANGAVAPTVSTTTATTVKSVSAVIGGNVTADGGDPTIQRGIVWATTPNPTILSNKFQIGTGLGTFTNTVTGLTPGSLIYYRAYATNSAGTSYGAELTLTTGAALSTSSTPQTNVSCNGGSNGTATVNVIGGAPGYTYLWTNGATAATASGLGVGAISVTVTDSELTQITRTYTIGQPTILNGTPSVTNVSCNGGNNGTATITASGGTPGYTYLWSNGATTATASGLLAGTYSVTITDANSCPRTINNIIVGQPAILNGTPSVTNVSCFGGTNGTATIAATGGTPGYTYLWSNGATTATATGLLSGTYSVTITDANSCTRTVNNIIVGQPAVILDGTASTTTVSCFGGSNGTATIAPTGGTPGYTYLWSNGATTATATGLLSGTYSVTITDANSCTRLINNIVVGQPAAILNGTPSTTAVSCFGGTNGTATITASGGTPGYTYLWSNGATTATATGLIAGTYSVTITDANSCSRLINNIVVGTPTAFIANPTQINVSCNGGSNASATVAPTGGAGSYTYLWSTGATTATISALTQGSYNVTITDANLCQTTQNFTISQPSLLVASQGTINNVSCNGGSNGSATVIATGGAGGYTYSWSPSGGTAATASGLTIGTYTVTVTDANACQATQTFTLTQPDALAATTTQNNILCNGSATGSATVTPTGGAGSYTYSWAPTGGTAATASGLTAGTYTVTVTDANLCQTTATVTITQPATALVASPVSMTNIGCRGEATGSATVNATGGTGSYTYSWAPSGGTAATASGLAAGTYTVTVTDANLCQATQTFTITQPAAILSATTASTGVSCFGGSNGSASVTVSGGTPGYTYLWAPLGGTVASISGRPAGNYTCTITDANGCTLVKNITISTPAQFSGTIAKTDVSCNGGSNGVATVTATGATSPYTYSWSPSGGTGATASGLQAGNYTVTVQDANTCTYTVNVTINQPAPLAVVASQTNVLCNGGATGTASVVVSGGTPGYTYVWSPAGGTAATATGLTAGSYTCLITDNNGCIYSQNFTIIQPAVLNSSTSKIDATCTTGGQAAVNPTGGTLPYTYLWTNGATTQIVTNLAAGNHAVTITDGNGCTIVRNFIINTTNTLTAATSQIDVLCNGSNTGSLTVIPSGAPGPFTYVWSPSGGTSDTASNLTAGNYSVTITAVNGCSIVKNFTITEPTAIVVAPSQTNLACNGETNGSASVNVTGGAGGYTYAWSPSGGTASSATGLIAGTYTVTITDANLCQAIQSFTITEPAALTALSTATNVSCNGGSNGSATVNVTGGTGAYTYTWSPTGGSAATATGLVAGTYTVTITDANSCTITEAITIIEPLILDATITLTDVTCLGAADGSATVTPTGGTSPYTYQWSPSGGTAATATGLVAGNYTVTITDANSCTVTKSVTIITTPDVTAPIPDVANLPVINSNCSIVSSQIPVPTATDNCAGIINATTSSPLNYTAIGTYVITWNYNDGNGNVSSQNQTVNVTASPLNLVTFSNAEFTYNGSVHAVQVANLPAGASVAYSITPTGSTQNGAINVGTYTVTAIVTPSVSSPNCSPVTLTAQLTIKKAAQQITFAAIAPKILGLINNFNLEAASNSGLPIRYSFTYTSALPPANVSAIGLVNLLRSGELLIVAHQDGNANYLPAADVSQLLVIKNNDVTVTEIKIGTKSYPNPAKDIKYVMQCGENNVNVVITNQTNAIITPSANFTITPPKPGIYTQNVGLTSQDGSTTANYTITVEKPFGFYDIVVQKFNNVLLVNNNPKTNGGYEFVAYQWFKNGQLVGTGQYYSAGEDLSNSLDTSADFSVKMTTKDGKVLSTCSAKISIQKAVAAKLYPNPIQTGKVITVEADFPQEELENLQISLYSVSGQLVKTLKSSSVKTEIQLPDAESNMYIVVLETPNIKKTLKVIVNK